MEEQIYYAKRTIADDGRQYWELTSKDEPHEFETLNPLTIVKPDYLPQYITPSDIRNKNVTDFRNFLIECDTISLDEQRKLIRSARDDFGLHPNRIVFSGNKSYHVIYRFCNDFGDECQKFYKEIFEILSKRAFHSLNDQQCCNPCRWTRSLNEFREDTCKIQTGRDYHSSLGDWDVQRRLIRDAHSLYAYKQMLKPRLTRKPVNKSRIVVPSEKALHYLNTPYPLMRGNGTSDRDLFIALASCVARKDGATLNRVIDKALSEGWTEHEIQQKLTRLEANQ